jgi:hypothetical protein
VVPPTRRTASPAAGPLNAHTKLKMVSIHAMVLVKKSYLVQQELGLSLLLPDWGAVVPFEWAEAPPVQFPPVEAAPADLTECSPVDWTDDDPADVIE